jgi:hypothetical protein
MAALMSLFWFVVGILVFIGSFWLLADAVRSIRSDNARSDYGLLLTAIASMVGGAFVVFWNCHWVL